MFIIHYIKNFSCGLIKTTRTARKNWNKIEGYDCLNKNVMSSLWNWDIVSHVTISGSIIEHQQQPNNRTPTVFFEHCEWQTSSWSVSDDCRRRLDGMSDKLWWAWTQYPWTSSGWILWVYGTSTLVNLNIRWIVKIILPPDSPIIFVYSELNVIAIYQNWSFFISGEVITNITIFGQ